MFIFYTVSFALSIVWTARSAWHGDWETFNKFLAITAFLFLGMMYKMPWSQMEDYR
jgi:hypothetical protein